MPSILSITPQDVDTIEKRKKFSIAIVGCGHKGILFANAFADAGYRVICTDADASVVKKATRGKTVFYDPSAEAKLKTHIAKDEIDVTGELEKAVIQGDVVIIAITTKFDEQKKIDTQGLINRCKQVGAALKKDTLVIYGGIAPLGFVGSTVKDLLENTSGLKIGQGLGLAYCPIVTTNVSLFDLGVNVSAYDEISLEAALVIFETLTNNVQKIVDLKTAELATLFGVAIQDVTNALTNELAIFCEKIGINYYRIIEALNLNDDFQPSISEVENYEAIFLLLEEAENLNAKLLRIPELARQINSNMIKHAVSLTLEALKKSGKNFRKSTITILGPAKPGSATCILANQIEQKGARVTIYDPLADKKEDEESIIKTSFNEALEGTDCIVILSRQEQFNHLYPKKLKALMKTPAIIVDLVDKFKSIQADGEGFIYTGLGKGLEKNE